MNSSASRRNPGIPLRPTTSNLTNRNGDSPSSVGVGVGSSGSTAGSLGTSGSVGAYDQEDRQNDEQFNALAQKVSLLKNVTIKINDEVSNQNRFISSMSQDMTRTDSLLGRTMGNLQVMMRTQNGKYIWYMMVVVVGFFMVIYWIWKRGG